MAKTRPSTSGKIAHHKMTMKDRLPTTPRAAPAQGWWSMITKPAAPATITAKKAAAVIWSLRWFDQKSLPAAAAEVVVAAAA